MSKAWYRSDSAQGESYLMSKTCDLLFRIWSNGITRKPYLAEVTVRLTQINKLLHQRWLCDFLQKLFSQWCIPGYFVRVEHVQTGWRISERRTLLSGCRPEFCRPTLVIPFSQVNLGHGIEREDSGQKKIHLTWWTCLMEVHCRILFMRFYLISVAHEQRPSIQRYCTCWRSL